MRTIKILKMKDRQIELFSSKTNNGKTNQGDIHLIKNIANYSIFNQKKENTTLHYKDKVISIKITGEKGNYPKESDYNIYKILLKKLIEQITIDNSGLKIKTSFQEILDKAKEFSKSTNNTRIQETLDRLSKTNYKITTKYLNSNKTNLVTSFNIIDTYTLETNQKQRTEHILVEFSSIIKEAIQNINYFTTYYNYNMKLSYKAERIVFYLFEKYHYARINKHQNSIYPTRFLTYSQTLYNETGIKDTRDTDKKKKLKKYLDELQKNQTIKSYQFQKKYKNLQNETVIIYPDDLYILLLKKLNFYKKEKLQINNPQKFNEKYPKSIDQVIKKMF